MLNLFLDADIILDLLAKREPHYQFAARLFTLIDKAEVNAFTSPVIIANIHYILQKSSNREMALLYIRKLKSLVKILSVDEKIIEQALNSNFKDFEDAIQYYTAINNSINFIITRNKQDYKDSKIPIATAEEFLTMLASNSL